MAWALLVDPVFHSERVLVSYSGASGRSQIGRIDKHLTSSMVLINSHGVACIASYYE